MGLVEEGWQRINSISDMVGIHHMPQSPCGYSIYLGPKGRAQRGSCIYFGAQVYTTQLCGPLFV